MGSDRGVSAAGDGPRTPDTGGAGSKVTDVSITYKRVTFLKNRVKTVKGNAMEILS